MQDICEFGLAVAGPGAVGCHGSEAGGEEEAGGGGGEGVDVGG